MAGTSKEEKENQTENDSSSSVELRNTEEEILFLSKNFRGQCKVIKGAGRFPYTVKLHPEALDIVFNFKLTDQYPVDAPVIVVRSDALSEVELYELTNFVSKMSEDPRERASLQQLVNTALDWLKEGGISVKGGSKRAPNGKAIKKKGKKGKKPTDVKIVPKKPPMKTATDVVKRIMWDQALSRDAFLVGYLDRIDGLKEKYFTAFSWEDIASVDYNVLAIPKHRIQYFKYKGEIVWDKRCRLDNVFGSTGSKVTMTDVIKRLVNATGIEERAESFPEEDNAAMQPAQEYHHDSDYSYSEDDSDSFSDSDSDDGINVTIGHVYDHDDGNDIDDGEEGGTFNKYWRDRLRPNYFLALRITDEEVRSSMKSVQDCVVDNEPRFAECCIPTGALHLTLCTVGLDTPEQVENAVKCLQQAKRELSSIVPKDKKLKVVGVDNFFHRVVYAKMEVPQEFLDFVDHLKLCLTEQGVAIRDYHEFVPHATLMKISRPFSKRTGKKYISPWLYSNFNHTVFGEQTVDNIHLCEMGDDRQKDGFYVTATSLSI